MELDPNKLGDASNNSTRPTNTSGGPLQTGTQNRLHSTSIRTNSNANMHGGNGAFSSANSVQIPLPQPRATNPMNPAQIGQSFSPAPTGFYAPQQNGQWAYSPEQIAQFQQLCNAQFNLRANAQQYFHQNQYYPYQPTLSSLPTTNNTGAVSTTAALFNTAPSDPRNAPLPTPITTPLPQLSPTQTTQTQRNDGNVGITMPANPSMTTVNSDITMGNTDEIKDNNDNKPSHSAPAFNSLNGEPTNTNSAPDSMPLAPEFMQRIVYEMKQGCDTDPIRVTYPNGHIGAAVNKILNKEMYDIDSFETLKHLGFNHDDVGELPFVLTLPLNERFAAIVAAEDETHILFEKVPEGMRWKKSPNEKYAYVDLQWIQLSGVVRGVIHSYESRHAHAEEALSAVFGSVIHSDESLSDEDGILADKPTPSEDNTIVDTPRNMAPKKRKVSAKDGHASKASKAIKPKKKHRRHKHKKRKRSKRRKRSRHKKRKRYSDSSDSEESESDSYSSSAWEYGNGWDESSVKMFGRKNRIYLYPNVAAKYRRKLHKEYKITPLEVEILPKNPSLNMIMDDSFLLAGFMKHTFGNPAGRGSVMPFIKVLQSNPNIMFHTPSQFEAKVAMWVSKHGAQWHKGEDAPTKNVYLNKSNKHLGAYIKVILGSVALRMYLYVHEDTVYEFMNPLNAGEAFIVARDKSEISSDDPLMASYREAMVGAKKTDVFKNFVQCMKLCGGVVTEPTQTQKSTKSSKELNEIKENSCDSGMNAMNETPLEEESLDEGTLEEENGGGNYDGLRTVRHSLPERDLERRSLADKRLSALGIVGGDTMTIDLEESDDNSFPNPLSFGGQNKQNKLNENVFEVMDSTAIAEHHSAAESTPNINDFAEEKEESEDKDKENIVPVMAEQKNDENTEKNENEINLFGKGKGRRRRKKKVGSAVGATVAGAVGGGAVRGAVADDSKELENGALIDGNSDKDAMDTDEPSKAKETQESTL